MRWVLIIAITLLGGVVAWFSAVDTRRSHWGLGLSMVIWVAILVLVWQAEGHMLPPALEFLEMPLVILVFPLSLGIVVQSSRRLAKGQSPLLFLPLLAGIIALFIFTMALVIGTALSGARMVG